MTSILTKKNVLLILFAAALLTPFISFALNAVSEGYRTTGTDQKINAHNVCKEVRQTGSNSYFVPTKTATEWSTFLSKKPSDVAVSNCCTSIPEESFYIYGSCSSGAGSIADCPAGYTTQNRQLGFPGSGSYDGDCTGNTTSGSQHYTMYSQQCVRAAQNYCNTSSCQTYPEFSYERTDQCGQSGANLTCPAGYNRVHAASGTCQREGDIRTRYTVTCTLPAQTFCASD